MRRRAVLGTLGALATGCVSTPATTDPGTTSDPDAEYRVTDLHGSTAPGHPIEFDAETIDSTVAPADPATLEFSLTNTGHALQEVFSGTVPPFGIVGVDRQEDAGEFLLWRPYTDQGCVTFSEDRIVKCDIGYITDLAPGETISRDYDVLPSTTDHHPDYTVPPGPGRYHTTTDVSYSRGGDAPSQTLSSAIEFSLETG